MEEICDENGIEMEIYFSFFFLYTNKSALYHFRVHFDFFYFFLRTLENQKKTIKKKQNDHTLAADLTE